MSTLDNVILDEGLSRLAGTGPEFGGGLSNHGPMAAEALLRLGRADEIGQWLDAYIRRLDEAPRPGDRVTEANWRDALGDLRRVADWEDYFRAEMAEGGWRAVLNRWWPRLIFGLAAGATHGIIRTSHAARSLADAAAASADTAERETELARGLAYWAARYTELPDTPGTGGKLDLSAALGGLPRAPEIPRRHLITETLEAGLAGQPGFPAAMSALRPPNDVAADLFALAREFVRVFLVYGRERPIPLLHAVTAPVAARSVLPLLDENAARPTYDALWQIDAAIYAVYTGALTPEPLPVGAHETPDQLADRAVAVGDEHAIKLTEACLRLYAEVPDPVFAHAAARASDLLGRSG
jgi:hypothetical protein